MPSPLAAFDELVTTTLNLQHNKGELYDNVSKHNALYRKIWEANGNQFKKVRDGGDKIKVDLAYAENGTFMWFDGYELLSVSAQEVISAALYAWKTAVIHVTANGPEILKNQGSPQKIKDLVKSRVAVAKMTIANQLNIAAHGDGTAFSGKSLDGLRAIVSDTGLGTVGGINASTWAFWRNVVQSAAAPLQGGGAITPSASTIQSLMRPLFVRLTRGVDKPDLILAAENYYNLYLDSLSENQRYMDPKMAEAGFVSVKFMGCDVVHETEGSGITASRMYFLNSKYLDLQVHQDAQFQPAEEKQSVNQWAFVKPMYFMGNMTCANRSMQGVLKP